MSLQKEIEISNKILKKKENELNLKVQQLKQINSEIELYKQLIKKASFKNYLEKLGIVELAVLGCAVINPFLRMAIIPLSISMAISTIAGVRLYNRYFVQKVSKTYLSEEEISSIIHNRYEILKSKEDKKRMLKDKKEYLNYQIAERKKLNKETQAKIDKEIDVPIIGDEPILNKTNKQYVKKILTNQNSN